MTFYNSDTGRVMTDVERVAYAQRVTAGTRNLDELVEEVDRIRTDDLVASVHDLNMMLAEFDRRTTIACLLESFIQTPREAMILASMVTFLEVARLRAQVISLGGTP